jgi:hypothetical protein
MLPRRLSAILQVPEHQRYAVLSEGLELLADNVATLSADVDTLGNSRRDRGAAVLRCFAEEEAAKVMILLDLARAGWNDHAASRACLSRFYNHLARGLYVLAYSGAPADLAEVRHYVDMWRQEFHLDGPMDVDWIFGNTVTTSREERLYVDYTEDENGDRRWTGPAEHSAIFDEPYSFPEPTSIVVRLVASMRHIGLLSEEGLEATRAVWETVTVDDTMHWTDLQPLTLAVIGKLVDSGRDYATQEVRLDEWLLRVGPPHRYEVISSGQGWPGRAGPPVVEELMRRCATPMQPSGAARVAGSPDRGRPYELGGLLGAVS